MVDKHKIRAGKILIRRVFLEDWDPIGIGSEPAAQDEYDAYLGGAYMLLARKASEQEIIAYLHGIEKDRMGMSRDQSALHAVARKLQSLAI